MDFHETQDMSTMTQGAIWNILGVMCLTPWIQDSFFYYLGPCLLAASWNNGWIDIHEILRIWTHGAFGWTVSRPNRLYHAPQTRCGGCLCSQNASCLLCVIFVLSVSRESCRIDAENVRVQILFDTSILDCIWFRFMTHTLSPPCKLANPLLSWVHCDEHREENSLSLDERKSPIVVFFTTVWPLGNRNQVVNLSGFIAVGHKFKVWLLGSLIHCSGFCTVTIH